MEFSGVTLPPIAQCFLIFFVVSIALLLLIMIAGLPTLFRAVRREVKLAFVRRRRSGRMLADGDQLDRNACELKGVYDFEG